MKFATLSLAAVGAIVVSAGFASAHPPGYYRPVPVYAPPVVVRPAPVVVVPAYPSYYAPAPVVGSGFGLTIGGPNGVISIGSGSVVPAYPSYYAPRPYYGGYVPAYGYPRRW